MDSIKQFFIDNYFSAESTSGYEGIIRLILDVLLILIIIFLLVFHIKQKIKISRLLIVVGFGVALYVASLLLNLPIVASFLKQIGGWIIGIYVLLYHQELRLFLEGKKTRDSGINTYNSKQEKEATIKIICSTIEHLSKNKIGALITFERRDNLDKVIEKAININADITQEILTTIFTVGTACHDGGVIIRNNRIACAGAYYDLSDNYDIPKMLGTRHRAAIGISEKYDAITIVVSEETGNISLTSSGNINLELTVDRVARFLDNYLESK